MDVAHQGTLPKATAQQSCFPWPSDGSSTATGLSFCRTSHTFTVPSLLPVTSSAVPFPMLRPPTPSISLMMELWPFAE